MPACSFAPASRGCTASADEVRPPADQLFFPTGMAVAPDDSVLFVANANSELRYDSGLDQRDRSRHRRSRSSTAGSRATTIPADCTQDPDHTETLICDEAQFMQAGAGVRIGNFATDIAVQDTRRRQRSA